MSNTNGKRRTLIVSSLGLISIGALAWTSAGGGAALLPTTDDAHVSFRRALWGSGRDGEGPCTLSEGTRMAYDVETASNTKIDMNSIAANVAIGGNEGKAAGVQMDRSARRRWHVELEAIAVDADDGSTVLAAKIDGGAVEMEGVTAPPMEGLDDTFLVRLGSRCNIEEFGWRTEGSLAAAQDQQRLMAGLGWLAPHGDDDRWAGTVLDAVGWVNAAYFVDGEVVRGRALDYEESFGRAVGMGRPVAEIAESELEITPREGRWFESLSNRSTTSLTLESQTFGVIQGAVVATAADVGPWRSQVSAADEGWTWGLLLGRSLPKTAREVAMNSPLRGVGVDKAIAMYLDGGGSYEAKRLLIEWLRANPEGAAALVDQLRAGVFGKDDIARAGVFAALGRAQTPQAAAALVAIIESPDDLGRHKMSAAFALTQVEAPTEQMVDAVVAVVERDDLNPGQRGMMRATLGAFADSNEQRAPEVAAKAREQIGEWLAESKSDVDLRSSLAAAGNTGHDDLISSIEPYLDHEDPDIRSRAAEAMRQMSPEEAYPRLASTMADESSSVRTSAIDAMVEVSRTHDARPPSSLVGQVTEHLETAGSAGERDALISLLGEASKRGSELARNTLRMQTQKEMSRADRDLGTLQSLGREAAPRWKAD